MTTHDENACRRPCFPRVPTPNLCRRRGGTAEGNGSAFATHGFCNFLAKALSRHTNSCQRARARVIQCHLPHSASTSMVARHRRVLPTWRRRVAQGPTLGAALVGGITVLCAKLRGTSDAAEGRRLAAELLSSTDSVYVSSTSSSDADAGRRLAFEMLGGNAPPSIGPSPEELLEQGAISIEEYRQRIAAGGDMPPAPSAAPPKLISARSKGSNASQQQRARRRRRVSDRRLSSRSFQRTTLRLDCRPTSGVWCWTGGTCRSHRLHSSSSSCPNVGVLAQQDDGAFGHDWLQL